MTRQRRRACRRPPCRCALCPHYPLPNSQCPCGDTRAGHRISRVTSAATANHVPACQHHQTRPPLPMVRPAVPHEPTGFLRALPGRTVVGPFLDFRPDSVGLFVQPHSHFHQDPQFNVTDVAMAAGNPPSMSTNNWYVCTLPLGKRHLISPTYTCCAVVTSRQFKILRRSSSLELAPLTTHSLHPSRTCP